MRFLPNLLSFLRLLLSPGVLFLAQRGETKESALLFLILALSDALDGALARLMNARTQLGKFLDPLADKVLLFFGLFTVSFYTDVKVLPILFKLLVTRDLLLIGGTLLLKRLGFVPEPSLLGKLTTFVISTVVGLTFMMSLTGVLVPSVLFHSLQMISILLVVASAIDYTLKGIGYMKSKLIIERR